jgi:hypothetical protein
MIHVRRQLDLSAGEITWPKDDDGRWVPMSPALYAHFEAMPRMGKVVHEELGEIVFPSVRGGYMRRSQWCSLWNAIRVAAEFNVRLDTIVKLAAGLDMTVAALCEKANI